MGPYFAGLILDSGNPHLLWALCGVIGMLATLGFILLNKARSSTAPAIEPAAAD